MAREVELLRVAIMNSDSIIPSEVVGGYEGGKRVTPSIPRSEMVNANTNIFMLKIEGHLVNKSYLVESKSFRFC